MTGNAFDANHELRSWNKEPSILATSLFREADFADAEYDGGSLKVGETTTFRMITTGDVVLCFPKYDQTMEATGVHDSSHWDELMEMLVNDGSIPRKIEEHEVEKIGDGLRLRLGDLVSDISDLPTGADTDLRTVETKTGARLLLIAPADPQDPLSYASVRAVASLDYTHSELQRAWDDYVPNALHDEELYEWLESKLQLLDDEYEDEWIQEAIHHLEAGREEEDD